MNSIPDERTLFQQQSRLKQEEKLHKLAQKLTFEEYLLYLNWYYEERKWNDHYDY